jgi:ribosomal protein L40E
MLAAAHSMFYSDTPLFVVVLGAALLIVLAASRSRQHNASTELKLCKSCGTSHPQHARFCRQCGKNLTT